MNLYEFFFNLTNVMTSIFDLNMLWIIILNFLGKV
jgi:hypothetical protein